MVTHVGEAIPKCRTKVEKLEEAHQGELTVAEEKRELTAYSKVIYTRKFETASKLREAFSVRLDRRKNILKGKAQDTTGRSDTDVSDGGYSDCSDIEGSPYREKYNIRKIKKRKPFPREQDFPEEEVTGNTSFDNAVVENNLSENSSYIQSEEEGGILIESDLDLNLNLEEKKYGSK